MAKEIDLTRAGQILGELCHKNKDIQGGALIADDGKILAHTFGEIHLPRRIALTSGALLNVFHHSPDTLQIGAFREYFLEGGERSALVYAIGKVMLLLVVNKKANFGLVSLEGSAAAKEISYEFLDF